MNRSDIDQKFLDDVIAYRYPDITETATEMAAGTEPPGATPMTMGEFATSVADVPAGLLKGAVQGTVGLPGDIESLTYGIRELFNRRADEGALDAFLRGLEQKTILPTTENVKKWLDENVGTLVPAGASERRTQAAKIPEFVGELGGAGKTVIEASKAAGRGLGQVAGASADMAARTPAMQAGSVKPSAFMPSRAAPAAEPQRSNIGFYSAVEKAVLDSKQDKGTGAQFLAQITKTQGVKPEELKWTGLDEFLKGKKSVTKQEIQDYLQANRVDVQEVRLGNAPLSEQAFNERFARRGFSMVQTDDGPRFRKTDMTGSRQLTYGELPEDIQATIERQSIPQTKHHLGAYQGIKTEIPGGENYREILLTLPSGPRQTKFEVFDPSTQRAVPFETREEAVAFANQDPTRSSVVAEVDVSKPEYRSTHFDQPNILAHMRVNDRVVDGKKTLFIEEIQSDWHQAGRKKGYKSEIDPNENALLVKQYDSLTAERRQIEGIVATGDDASPVTQNAIQNLNRINAELKRISDRLSTIRTAAKEGVPDAPFKTSWHELTLKRAIQEASEKGYDQIAFTTGKTQAERYDLSKQVDSVTWIPKGDGTYDFEVLKDDATIMSKRDADASWLEDNVGKELAQKIVNDQHTDILEGSGRRFIEGNDLSVGGEGMKGFYDNILPKSLEKLGKKFDAKVGKTEMDGVEVWQMDITPKMRETVTKQGQPLFQIGVGGGAAAGAATMQQPGEQM